MGAELLLAWSRNASGLLGYQILFGCAVEDTCSTALMVRQLVSPLGVQVLQVDGVAPRAYFYGRSACDLRKAGPLRNLSIGIVAEFGIDVVEVAAHLF